jgi:C_GCAxxG_C_C family probable redox protein
VSEHTKRAKELFEQGYNCAQSVFAAFSDEIGMYFETALKISSSFGGGMGRLREVCGAVTAMFMIAGIELGYADPKDDKAKAEHYKLIQSLAFRFKELHGSFICRDLLGLDRGADDPTPEKRSNGYYHSRPCSDFVECAAEMIEEFILKKMEAKNENSSGM